MKFFKVFFVIAISFLLAGRAFAQWLTGTAATTTSTTATVTWASSAATNTKVKYGLTTAYGTATPVQSAFTLQHSVLIKGLTPNSIYHFRTINVDTTSLSLVGLDNTFQTLMSGAVLQWGESANATSYNVYRSITNGGPYAPIATGLTGTGYTDTNVTRGTTYFYVVTAVDSDGESGNSPQAQCIIP